MKNEMGIPANPLSMAGNPQETPGTSSVSIKTTLALIGEFHEC